MLMFTAMHQNRHAIQKFGHELRQYNQKRGSGQTANQLIKSKQARNSFSTLTTEIRWLLPKVEKFRPEYWYHGIVLLALRLLQTSFLALTPSQVVQAAVMCLVTLVAVTLQRELSPYRRVSDNHVALLAQWLVFAWTFSLMLRIAGVFQKPVAAIAIGVILCVATVSVFVLALLLANIDRLNEKRAEQLDLNTPVSSNSGPTAEDSNDASGEEESGEIEAGASSQGRESQAERGNNSPQDSQIGVAVLSLEEEEQLSAARANTKSPWGMLGLCAAEHEVGDTRSSDDNDVAVLLAKIEAQSKTIREKDVAIREKDEEISRLTAGDFGGGGGMHNS